MHQAFPGMAPVLRCAAMLAVGATVFLAGCASPPLTTARANFYAGNFETANTNLAVIPKGDKDEILYLMERGMIRQNLGQYRDSAADWRRAGELDAKLDTYSISQGASSLIVNDRTLSFRGMPFERTLLYAFLAKDYLAESNWDYAAICARNIIKKLEERDGFPDIAYGRYMAGFCLELINDEGNAAIQYRVAANLLTNSVLVDPLSGDILPLSKDVQPASTAVLQNEPAELVCFVTMGRMPVGEFTGNYYDRFPPYAEIYCKDEYLGRSYPFANTATLMEASRRRMAAIQLAKDTARLAAKIAISEAVKQQNDALGALVLMTLLAMDVPDTRCWETLPLWLEIARVPCPPDLKDFTVVFKSAFGAELGRQTITAPLVRRGKRFISFCRDAERK